MDRSEKLRENGWIALAEDVVAEIDPFWIFDRHYDIKRLLGLSLGRVLSNTEWTNQRAVLTRNLSHITDWLHAAIVNNESWLDRCDEFGRPKKLMKFGSLDQIIKEADKAMLKAAQKLQSIQLVEGDEELYQELSDGYNLVRLKTAAALDRESAEMQHCVGHGAYDESLSDDNSLILSLRDRSGKAHATINVEKNVVVEVQGKQNRRPIQKYMDVLMPFLKQDTLTVRIPASYLGHIIDEHGKWHPLDNLPDGLTIRGSLDIEDLPEIVLPDNFTVHQSLFASNSGLKKLPRGLKVGHSAYFDGTQIEEIPDDIVVGCDLSVCNTHVRKLPDNLRIPGDLRASNCPLTFIQKSIFIQGSIVADGTDVSVVEPGLKVGQSLILARSKIKDFPVGIQLGESGVLNIDDCPVAIIPEGLILDHGLIVAGHKLDRLPNDLKVRGHLDMGLVTESMLPAGVKSYVLRFMDDTRRKPDGEPMPVRRITPEAWRYW